MKAGELLFAAYLGAVLYGFAILWFGGEPLVVLKEFQELIVGLLAIGAIGIAYVQLRDERGRHQEQAEEEAERELEALRMASVIADWDAMLASSKRGKMAFGLPYHTFPSIPHDDHEFVLTNTKSYYVQRSINRVVQLLDQHHEVTQSVAKRLSSPLAHKLLTEPEARHFSQIEGYLKNACMEVTKGVVSRKQALNNRHNVKN